MQSDLIAEQIARSFQEGADLRLQLQKEATTAIVQAAQAIEKCFQNGGKILLFGCGGSAADAQHIAAEFVSRFVRERQPLPAIALTTDTSALTAIGNDYGFEHVFSRQIRALGKPEDVAIAISTSGRSPSVLAGVDACRQIGITTIGLTGIKGQLLVDQVDIPIAVPSAVTARIQECHLTVEHILCETVETLLFGPESGSD